MLAAAAAAAAAAAEHPHPLVSNDVRIAASSLILRETFVNYSRWGHATWRQVCCTMCHNRLFTHCHRHHHHNLHHYHNSPSAQRNMFSHLYTGTHFTQIQGRFSPTILTVTKKTNTIPCLKKKLCKIIFVRTLSNFHQQWKFLAIQGRFSPTILTVTKKTNTIPCLKKKLCKIIFVRTLSNFHQQWKFLAQRWDTV